MKKVAIFIIFCAVFFAGCSTKRQYFEPQNVLGEKSYSSKLKGSILYASRSGATLDSGDLITKNGPKSGLNLDENDVFLGEFSDKFIISNISGELRIVSNSSVIFKHKFNAQIISASLDNNLLAALSAENKLFLVDINLNAILMEYSSGAVFAQDSRIASPIFLNSLILYPTLDGKVMVVNKNPTAIVRDVVVSSEPFFNNIIFMGVSADRFFAASGEKLVMISPGATKYYDGKIKDALLHKDRIYVLLKDGRVQAMDLELNLTHEKEFKYAIFSNVVPSGDRLFIFEKTGYLIQTDLNLQDVRIYELSGAIKDITFAGKNAFYYDNKVLKIE